MALANKNKNCSNFQFVRFSTIPSTPYFRICSVFAFGSNDKYAINTNGRAIYNNQNVNSSFCCLLRPNPRKNCAQREKTWIVREYTIQFHIENDVDIFQHFGNSAFILPNDLYKMHKLFPNLLCNHFKRFFFSFNFTFWFWALYKFIAFPCNYNKKRRFFCSPVVVVVGQCVFSFVSVRLNLLLLPVPKHLSQPANSFSYDFILFYTE